MAKKVIVPKTTAAMVAGARSRVTGDEAKALVAALAKVVPKVALTRDFCARARAMDTRTQKYVAPMSEEGVYTAARHDATVANYDDLVAAYMHEYRLIYMAVHKCTPGGKFMSQAVLAYMHLLYRQLTDASAAALGIQLYYK